MGSFLAVWRIFARRGLSNWRMLAVLAVGIVVASTLLASAPIYARTMADLGLTFVIHDELKDHPSTRIEMRDQPLDTQDSRVTRDAIEKRIDERVGWFESARERYLRAPWMPLAKANQALGPGSPFGQLQSLTGYETHVKVIDGRLPAARGSGQPIEVAMGTGAFRRSGLKVGEQFTLSDDFDNCERTLPPPDVVPPPFPCKAQVIVRVGTPVVLVGVIEPSDVNDQFWVNTAGSYFDATNPFADGGPVLPLFTTETALLRDFGAAHPSYPVLLAYHVFADPTRLTRTNFERARDDIHALYKDVEPLGGVAYSPLTTTLDSFGKTAKYEQVPLTILLLEIAGVALFYVVLMSAVLVERQATEIALLRSRGATTTQLVALSLTEGLVVGIPVLVAAPFLAAAATALLGVTPVFEDVSGGDLLPVTIPLLSFGMAAIGVALSLLALAGPAFLVARRSAVTQRRAEGRPGISLIQRYYLDVAMVGLAGLLLWELRERGSVFTPSAAGGVSSDPLLLASPALIILAAAAILLRLYPLVLRLAARSVAPAAGATLAVASGRWSGAPASTPVSPCC
jgi:putative ABC transport system permease protein